MTTLLLMLLLLMVVVWVVAVGMVLVMFSGPQTFCDHSKGQSTSQLRLAMADRRVCPVRGEQRRHCC